MKKGRKRLGSVVSDSPLSVCLLMRMEDERGDEQLHAL